MGAWSVVWLPTKGRNGKACTCTCIYPLHTSLFFYNSPEGTVFL
jgi:hypothetical protein